MGHDGRVRRDRVRWKRGRTSAALDAGTHYLVVRERELARTDIGVRWAVVPPVAVGDAAADGASASEAGPSDAAPPVDAADCVSPLTVDPTSRGSVAFASGGDGAFGCPAGSQVAAAAAIRFTKDVQFTAYVNHTLSGSAAYARALLFPGCRAEGAPLVSAGSKCATDAETIPPGLYTFVACGGVGGPSFIAEPTPVPKATNTTCATAATVGGSP